MSASDSVIAASLDAAWWRASVASWRNRRRAASARMGGSTASSAREFIEQCVPALQGAAARASPAPGRWRTPGHQRVTEALRPIRGGANRLRLDVALQLVEPGKQGLRRGFLCRGGCQCRAQVRGIPSREAARFKPSLQLPQPGLCAEAQVRTAQQRDRFLRVHLGSGELQCRQRIIDQRLVAQHFPAFHCEQAAAQVLNRRAGPQARSRHSSAA